MFARRLSRASLALSLLTIVACGAHAPQTNTPSDPAHTEPAPTLRPATDYFLPATAAMAHVDVRRLRALSAYAPLWEIAEGLAQDESPVEQGLLAAFHEIEQATDTLSVGSTLRLDHGLDTDVVLVGRGHYELSSVRRWVALLARRVHRSSPARAADRAVSEHAGRPLFTHREVTIYSPDDQTMVWAYGVAPERLLPMFSGSTRAPGLLNGLLVWARQRGFGEHTMDAVALPGPALISVFGRRMWREERYLHALDAASLSIDVDAGLQAELRVETGYPAAAEALMERLSPMRGEAQEEVVTHVPVLGPFMRSLELHVDEAQIVATAAFTSEELESVLDFGVTMARASVGDDVVVGQESHQLLSADLEMICRVVRESSPASGSAEAQAELDQRIPSNATAAGQAELDQRIRSQLHTRGVLELWRALSSAAPEDRYSMLLRGAQELGVPGYECPALYRLFSFNP